ncbi:MAG: LLM class flavin-dependent oxidoreductase, partial [Planctomycetes bacterium]|nr:LLM class flavin-dependent oxidoreductase [Planctomycetota bacterium]
MQIGLYFDLRNPPGWRRDWARLYAQTLEWIEGAEHLGGQSIWLSEHHLFEDGYLPQPLTFAAAVAARTRRVRIGTAVLLAPLRSAAQIAEEAAVVDLISGGRLELGLGAGYRVPEFRAFGADFGTRLQVLFERGREIQRLHAEGGTTPPPVQRPLPLWFGVSGPRGARWAGRLGAGLLRIKAAQLGPYHTGLAEGGYSARQARMGDVFEAILADDPEAAWPRVAPCLAYQWDSYRRYAVEGTDRPAPPPIDPDQWRRPGPDGAPPR